MKLTLFFLVFFTCAYSQVFHITEDNSIPKESYKYLVIYREWESISKQNGFDITLGNKWITKTKLIDDFKSLKSWMNNGNYFVVNEKQKFTSIDENQLIGIYDLDTAKQIKPKFEKKEQTVEKHIEIEKESWTDQEWVFFE